jgi:acyl-CoA reductase-like NAD-dependent aldehyde dehydrogenase
VCPVVPYESLEEGFALANSTEYGLQSPSLAGLGTDARKA